MRALFYIPILCLAGCATAPEPAVKVQPVFLPVAAACVPKDTPPAPSSYPDDVLPKAKDQAAERYRLTAAANERRKARLALVEPIIAGCR